MCHLVFPTARPRLAGLLQLAAVAVGGGACVWAQAGGCGGSFTLSPSLAGWLWIFKAQWFL